MGMIDTPMLNRLLTTTGTGLVRVKCGTSVQALTHAFLYGGSACIGWHLHWTRRIWRSCKLRLGTCRALCCFLSARLLLSLPPMGDSSASAGPAIGTDTFFQAGVSSGPFTTRFSEFSPGPLAAAHWKTFYPSGRQTDSVGPFLADHSLDPRQRKPDRGLRPSCNLGRHSSPRCLSQTLHRLWKGSEFGECDGIAGDTVCGSGDYVGISNPR